MRVAGKISTSWFITQKLPHQQLGRHQLSDYQQNLIFLEETNAPAAKADLFAAGERAAAAAACRAHPQHLCFGVCGAELPPAPCPTPTAWHGVAARPRCPAGT